MSGSILLIKFLLILSLFNFQLIESAENDWWQNATFYQIYPRSWMDSDNDGNGDLQGIISRLDHLKDAGVTATWLSPIFKSPKVDQGYDISDYYVVDPMFGTNDDLKQLIDKTHELGLKLILDFVPNHTSDLHDWFQLSANRTPGYEDFYVWHDGKVNPNNPDEKNVPNNWISAFGRVAWTWHPERQQYYLHQFHEKQPDLNYSNPLVVEKMKDVLVYWMDQGVDGFRCDAVPFLFEDPNFFDEPLAYGHTEYNTSNANCLNHIYTQNLDATLDMIYQWRDVVDNYKTEHNTTTRVLMTESYSPVERLMLYYGTSDGSRLGAHFTFNFVFITNLNKDKFTVDGIINAIQVWQSNLPPQYTSNWVLGNHDQHRVANRLGKENIDGLNMLAGFLPGVQVTYYGEEIGMEDGEVNCTEGQDPQANCSNYEEVSRDFERTPFHWDNTTNAGFSKAEKTWLPVSKKYLENNLAAQSGQDVNSHYNIYKSLLQLRGTKLFPISGFDSLITAKVAESVLQISRLRADGEYILLFNVGDEEEKDIKIFSSAKTFKVLVASQGSNYKNGDVVEAVNLQGHESIIVETV